MLTRGIDFVKGISAKRLLIIALSMMGLVGAYLFQRQAAALFAPFNLSVYQLFVAQLTIRFVTNDLLMILLIYGLFHKRKYVIFAFYVQLAGILFILIPYVFLLIPYFMERYHIIYEGPLLSFLHRLVVNPLLMLLLIPAFFYQEGFVPIAVRPSPIRGRMFVESMLLRNVLGAVRYLISCT